MDAAPGERTAAQPKTGAARAADAPPFDWLNQWYPVAWTDDVLPLKPYAFSVWQRRYVLFLDAPTGVYVAMDDVCPHRAAPLSEGRLYEREGEQGRETILECGYHGWRFACSGRCVDIPVVDLAKRIPAAADVGGVYATSVQFAGLIFVFLGDRAKADERDIAQCETLRGADPAKVTPFRNVKRTLPTSFATILENVADPAHVQWAHHGVQGNRTSTPRHAIMEVVEADAAAGRFAVTIREGEDVAPRLILRYAAPAAMFYEVSESPAGAFFLLVWVVPRDPDTCDVFAVNAVVSAPWPLRLVKRLTPRWYEHTVSNNVLDGDTPMLCWASDHLQGIRRDSHGAAWKDAYKFSSGSWDTFVITFRRWLDTQADALPYLVPVAPDAPIERMSKRDINDRYMYHTKDCASCGPALRNFRRALVVVLVAAGVGAAAALFSSLTYMALKGGGAKFSVRPLWVCGVAGLVSSALLLLVARKINYFITLLTYTERSDELRLAES